MEYGSGLCYTRAIYQSPWKKVSCFCIDSHTLGVQQTNTGLAHSMLDQAAVAMAGGMCIGLKEDRKTWKWIWI